MGIENRPVGQDQDGDLSPNEPIQSQEVGPSPEPSAEKDPQLEKTLELLRRLDKASLKEVFNVLFLELNKWRTFNDLEKFPGEYYMPTTGDYGHILDGAYCHLEAKNPVERAELEKLFAYVSTCDDCLILGRYGDEDFKKKVLRKALELASEYEQCIKIYKNDSRHGDFTLDIIKKASSVATTSNQFMKLYRLAEKWSETQPELRQQMLEEALRHAKSLMECFNVFNELSPLNPLFRDAYEKTVFYMREEKRTELDALVQELQTIFPGMGATVVKYPDFGDGHCTFARIELSNRRVEVRSMNQLIMSNPSVVYKSILQSINPVMITKTGTEVYVHFTDE